MTIKVPVQIIDYNYLTASPLFLFTKKGVARFYKPKKNHIVTVQTVSFVEQLTFASLCNPVQDRIIISRLVSLMQEHKCVLDSCRALEAEGFSVTYLPVQSNGIISLKVGWPNT